MSGYVAGRDVSLPYLPLADAPSVVELRADFGANQSLAGGFPVQGAWYQDPSHPTLAAPRLLVGVQLAGFAFYSAGTPAGSWQMLCEIGVGASGTVSACSLFVTGSWASATNTAEGAWAGMDLTTPILIPSGQELVSRLRLRSSNGNPTAGGGAHILLSFADPAKLT